jgi:hypothetical protein
MHDQKVNTKATEITPAPSKNVSLSLEYVGCIETPYGVQHIKRGEAMDHANMRSAQMTALVMMMKDEGAERFRNLSLHYQESLLWMISELSREMEAMFDIVATDALGSKQ